jgi:DNA-binding response OmpR family regulator
LKPADASGEAMTDTVKKETILVLSEPELPGGAWRQLLDGMERHSAPPSLIVSSRPADHRFRAEVLNLGGDDVLMTPLEAEEVVRVS